MLDVFINSFLSPSFCLLCMYTYLYGIWIHVHCLRCATVYVCFLVFALVFPSAFIWSRCLSICAACTRFSHRFTLDFRQICVRHSGDMMRRTFFKHMKCRAAYAICMRWGTHGTRGVLYAPHPPSATRCTAPKIKQKAQHEAPLIALSSHITRLSAFDLNRKRVPERISVCW